MDRGTTGTRLLHCQSGLLRLVARAAGACGGSCSRTRGRSDGGVPAAPTAATEGLAEARAEGGQVADAASSWEEQCRARTAKTMEMQAHLRGRAGTGSTWGVNSASLGCGSMSSPVGAGHFRNEALSQAGFKIGATVEVLNNLLMREEEALTSCEVCELSPKLQCLVLQHGNDRRRLKVRVYNTNHTGWISAKTEEGEELIQAVVAGSPPRTSFGASSTGCHPRVTVVGGSNRPSLTTSQAHAQALGRDVEVLPGGVMCCLFLNRKRLVT